MFWGFSHKPVVESFLVLERTSDLTIPSFEPFNFLKIFCFVFRCFVLESLNFAGVLVEGGFRSEKQKCWSLENQFL